MKRQFRVHIKEMPPEYFKAIIHSDWSNERIKKEIKKSILSFIKFEYTEEELDKE